MAKDDGKHFTMKNGAVHCPCGLRIYTENYDPKEQQFVCGHCKRHTPPKELFDAIYHLETLTHHAMAAGQLNKDML